MPLESQIESLTKPVTPCDRNGATGEPPVPLTLHGLTLLLACLTCLAFGIAQAEFGMTPTRWWILAGQLIAMLAAAYGFRRLAREWSSPPAIAPLLVGLGLISYIREPVVRLIWETGRPFEMIAMQSMRDLVLGLAAAACWRTPQRMTVLMSVFLVLFSAAIARDRMLVVLCALYGVVSLATLVMSYWETLRPRLLTVDEAHSPRRWILLGAAVIMLGVLSQTRAGQPVMRVMRGLVPSSGGDGAASPYARDGVGDGDMLVAGMDDIRTFGPIEDAPFISDHKPSLYDVFDDRYEEPVEPPKEQDRAVSLSPEMAAKIEERHLKENQTVSRDFSVLRQPKPSQARKTGQVNSDALLYVSGRVPLHLRMELHDRFDGLNWTTEEPPDSHVIPTLRMQTVEGRPWLLCDSISNKLNVLAEPETHALKIIRMDSARIPSPLYLQGVHIDQVATESMFRRSQFGMIELDRDTLPEMVPIHLCSSALDRRQITAEFPYLLGAQPNHRFVPAIEGMGRIATLAKEWTAGVPKGWEQVETISRRLREEYVLDEDWRPEAGCPSPVAHFLFISKRGPDYLFASSAALMLRSLGYSTRFVTGFYANPQRYDRQSGHTPVTKDDAHAWVECSLGANHWATVEATPGYEVLDPPPTLVARALAALRSILWTAWDQRLMVGIFLSVLATVLAARKLILDWLRTLRWRWRPEPELRRYTLSSLRLLEQRLSSVGLTRPASMTFTTWIVRTPLRDTAAGEALLQLGRISEWARYGMDEDRPHPERDRQVCQLAESAAKRSRLQELLRPSKTRAPHPSTAFNLSPQ
jgi:hypothetical protein